MIEDILHVRSARSVALLCSSLAVAAQAEVALVGPELQISTDTVLLVEVVPSVAAFPDGQFVVAWSENIELDRDPPLRAEVMARQFGSSGDPMGPEFLVNSYTTGSQGFPVVSTWSGGFVIVWQSFPMPFSSEPVPFLAFQRYDAAATPLGGETAFRELGSRPQVAANESGFVAAWRSSTEEGRVLAQAFDHAGEPNGDALSVLPSDESAALPSLSLLADGGFVVAWSGVCDQSGLGVVARQFDSLGEPRGGLFCVNQLATGERPSVAGEPNGGFIVVWTNSAEGNAVVARRFTADGTPAGDEFRVSTVERPAGSQLFVPAGRQVAVDASGSFVVVWETSNECDRGILVRAFDRTGAPMGSELFVNTSSIGEQNRPAITASQDGRFVVVWNDWSDTSSGVVRGRLLELRSALESPSPPTAATVTPVCSGDCDLDREVEITELVAGVRILFAEAPVCECYPFDVDSDGTTSIVDLLQAVASALDGCPS